MKRLISLVLVCALLLSGCGPYSNMMDDMPERQEAIEERSLPMDQYNEDSVKLQTEKVNIEDADSNPYKYEIDFDDLDDDELMRYVKDNVYAELVRELNSEQYFVENVSTAYISQEYIEELAFNSQANIFFGYTLAELDEAFQGTRYVFTLGDDGATTVEAFKGYDNTYEKAIKNVAVGSGVILLCVTVSVVTGGVGAPAISMIFAASAKTGTTLALSSGLLSGVAAGVVTGIQTGDMEQAKKAAALTGSESFKWGAITGVVSGGASEAVALKGLTLNGLTINEAAIIQKESGFPADVIKQFRNMDQYNICKNAGLTSKMINGKTALVRKIDLNYVDDVTGYTNLELMYRGYAPIDPATGTKYELHHIGQKTDSTLAILTEAEHRLGGNDTIWHLKDIKGEVHTVQNNWNMQRKQFWQAMAYIFENGGV